MEPDYDAAGSNPGSSDDEEQAMGAESDEDAAELGLDMAPPEFYDPDADDNDERWMAKHRRGHKSDAVLSCPLCFTTLCVDCQQHARYENQFRAMFVMNCKVITNEVVRIPAAAQKPARRKRRRQQEGEEPAPPAGGTPQRGQQEQQQQGGEDSSSGEVLHPVQCASCGTEVGLRDAEGIYHFHSVFASNA